VRDFEFIKMPHAPSNKLNNQPWNLKDNLVVYEKENDRNTVDFS